MFDPEVARGPLKSDRVLKMHQKQSRVARLFTWKANAKLFSELISFLRKFRQGNFDWSLKGIPGAIMTGKGNFFIDLNASWLRFSLQASESDRPNCCLTDGDLSILLISG
jgi:hypothetical protein